MSRKRRKFRHTSRHQPPASRERQRPENPADAAASSSPITPRADAWGSPDPGVEHCNLAIAPEPVVRESPNTVVRESPDPALTADRRSPEVEPANETPASKAARLNRRPSKFDAVAKARVCDLVSFGKSIAEAARIVGVCERTVHYAKDHDPDFEKKLHESYDDPTLVCMKTMKQLAADGDRKAAIDYWKALEPERFNPNLRAERRAKKTIDEFRRCLSSIMTEEQLEELDRRLNAKPRKRRRRD